MPLRDHFRPPLGNRRHWEGFHATWPAMIVGLLRRKLPRRYFAEPRVHLGSSVEIDVATFDDEDEDARTTGGANGGGVANAVWAPPRPTLTVATDLPAQDVYEVRVYDEKHHARLVAAIEIVSPANKGRPEHRRAFLAKCAGLLRERVSVVLVDIVTTRRRNLYGGLLDQIGLSDPDVYPEAPLYATACRVTKRGDQWLLESWAHVLELGEPLPTLPLWLADNLSVPLELEESYEQSGTILNLAGARA